MGGNSSGRVNRATEFEISDKNGSFASTAVDASWRNAHPSRHQPQFAMWEIKTPGSHVGLGLCARLHAGLAVARYTVDSPSLISPRNNSPIRLPNRSSKSWST